MEEGINTHNSIEEIRSKRQGTGIGTKGKYPLVYTCVTNPLPVLGGRTWRKWSAKQDQALKCPLTGKDWLIEGSTFNDFIGFQSEEARLISHLSSMIRTTKQADEH